MRASLVAALGLASCACAAQPPDCPRVLAPAAAPAPPQGWNAYSAGAAHPLERIGFYAGDPAGRASLVPDRVVSVSRESRDEWRFEPAGGETTWLACYYTGTWVYLGRPLEPGTTRCSVGYATTASGMRLRVTSLRCD